MVLPFFVSVETNFLEIEFSNSTCPIGDFNSKAIKIRGNVGKLYNFRNWYIP
jgi:hypothetical protein